MAMTSTNGTKKSLTNGARIRRKKRQKKQTILLPIVVFLLIIFVIGIVKTSLLVHRVPVSSNIEVGNKIRPPPAEPKRVNRTLINNDLATTEQYLLQNARDELDKFPISIGSDNDGNWEWILHPGDEALKAVGRSPNRKKVADVAKMLLRKSLSKTAAAEEPKEDVPSVENGYMRVPKFWDPPPFAEIADLRDQVWGSNSNIYGSDGVRRYLGNYGSRLMTPTEAKSIGSHKDGLETIYVTIASYRDWQCSSTVESAFSRASHPERIRVGVVDQIHEKDKPCSLPPKGSCEEFPNQASCLYRDQIDIFSVDAALSVGPVFARHLGHRMYRGEYFTLQSDAHITFVNGWDDEIVEQWHTAKNEMAVLSTYLSGVEDHINLETGERTSKSRPIMCESDYEGGGDGKHLRHGQQPEGVPYIHDMPTLNPYWAAGFSFGRGHFVVNVPYDQHLPWIFQGEEISMGLRGYSYGYDYYAAERSVCFHYYGRHGIPMFWENTSTYNGSGELGMTRLNAIIHMLPAHLKDNKWIRTDEAKYGIGKVRELQKFFDTFGIHVESQTVEHHLCKFVGRPMQKEFIPFLRENGMGLDYDKITYQWKEDNEPAW